MKGEYTEDKDSLTPTTLFSKFHHQQPPPSHHHFSGHRFQLSNTSEEAHSRSRSPKPNDGASIEVARRPRGRPPGSKNKPKPPIFITREPEPSMSPYVLELPGGSDIVDAVTRYCRKRNMGLCVLTGSGSVANVSLRQPSTTPNATVTFHGRFDVLSISATVIPSLPPPSSVTPFANGFTISLAGPQGQIVGGAVVGPLMAAGTVYIIATSFNNPLYHRLPAEDDDEVRNSGGNESSPAEGESGGHHAPPSTAVDSMSMYSCHLNSDVIWAPTPRQAPPHPPPY